MHSQEEEYWVVLGDLGFQELLHVPTQPPCPGGGQQLARPGANPPLQHWAEQGVFLSFYFSPCQRQNQALLELCIGSNDPALTAINWFCHWDRGLHSMMKQIRRVPLFLDEVKAFGTGLCNHFTVCWLKGHLILSNDNFKSPKRLL